MSDREFEYPGNDVLVAGGEPLRVPLGAGPPFPHVVVATLADGRFLLRRARDDDPPDRVRAAGDGPAPGSSGRPRARGSP